MGHPQVNRLIKATSNPRTIWLILCAVILSLWFLIPPSTFDSAQSKLMPVSLTKRSRLDIVLAHSGESPKEVHSGLENIKRLPAIARLKPRVIVYTKGATIPSNATDLEFLRNELGADFLFELRNIGREADTHLTHIVEHYDELADHTLFLRAPIEFLDLVEPMLRTHFRPTLGAMGLGTYTTCSCDDCIPGVNGSPDPVLGYKRIPQLYGIFNERFCPAGGLLLSFKNQFIVSRARIIRNPKQKFVWLKNVFNDMSHFIHNDPVEGQTISSSLDKRPDDPLFAHTLERSWMTIFGCSDVRIDRECDRHDFATRCACYDDDEEYV